MNIQYFLAPKLLTRNHISCSENALKLTYSNVEFQNFQYEYLYFNTYHEAAVNEPVIIYTPKQLLRERDRISINLYNFFYNSTIPLPSRGFAHRLISSRGQSHAYSIFSRVKTFNQKPYFFLRKCAKTHLQQCRISEFSGGGPPASRKGEERGGEGRW